ncbi:MAG TPA: NAD-dependent epimerase/dehydratase family protein [Rubrobacteraceae bacterium]|nr:NAD-dependent epimerase/dehydratase family protein [Rubrobacteraceae bacterium]
MEREKVLITGGAGFLGINLIRYLLARGYDISSLDVEEFDYPERDGIETIKGDIRDKALVERAMEDVDLVVHTAAALPLYTPDDIYTTDVEGTRNVLEAARRHGVKRVVHVSSTAVYGIPDHHPLYETDKLEGVGPYGQAKIQAEMICLEYRAKGMVVPVIRPKSFVGPERLGVFAPPLGGPTSARHSIRRAIRRSGGMRRTEVRRRATLWARSGVLADGMFALPERRSAAGSFWRLAATGSQGWICCLTGGRLRRRGRQRAALLRTRLRSRRVEDRR